MNKEIYNILMDVKYYLESQMSLTDEEYFG